MAQLDALKLVESVRERMVPFAASMNYLRDQELLRICEDIWRDGPGGLVSDLWVEATPPSELSDDTLSDLASEGLFSESLADQLNSQKKFPKDRKLFTHQSEAIRISGQKNRCPRPALVISSGTGSGKTESFLLPALNDIWETPRNPNGGMRCLILYPLNALVSDQVERVYELLKGQDEISVFHFTSGTPEDKKKADGIGEQEWELCRKRTRNQARGIEERNGKSISEDKRLPVPDIVVTNYSMLEYMLCRPQDQCFFGPDLRCIIIDEAHLYSGVLAAEISLLLRRVRDRCGVETGKVLHIATSATLGGGDDDLKDFARKLFSTDYESTFPIRGKKSYPSFQKNLKESPIIRELSQALSKKEIISLPDLSKQIRGGFDDDRIKITTLLLHLSAAAHDEQSLIPHRLHFLVSPPQGISVCLNPDCSGLSSRKYSTLGTVHSKTEICPDCESRCLPIWRCRTCGERFLVAKEAFSNGKAQFTSGEQEGDGNNKILLQPAAGEDGYLVKRDGSFGERNSSGVRLTKIQNQGICPVCDSPLKLHKGDIDLKEGIGPLTAGEKLGLSVFAETVLHGLPEFYDDSKLWKPAKGRRLLSFSDSRTQAARLGPSIMAQHQNRVFRAAIVDTMSELSNPEEYQKLKKEKLKWKEELKDGISETVRQILEEKLREIDKKLAQFEQGFPYDDIIQRLQEHPLLSEVLYPESGEKHTADKWTQKVWEDNHQIVKRKTEAAFALEFDRPFVSADSLEGMGLIEIVYPGIETVQLPNDVLGRLGLEKVESLEENWQNILATLLDTVRGEQCIGWSEAADARSWGDDPIFYGRWLSKNKERWGTVPFVGETLKQRRIKFISWILREIGCPEDDLLTNAKWLLEEAFEQLIRRAGEGNQDGELKWLRKKNQQVEKNQAADAIQILFDRLSFRCPLNLFLCQKTLTLWPRNILGFSPLSDSKDCLNKLTHEDADKDPRFGRPRKEIRESKVFRIGLWAEEHSAQVGENDRGRIQNLFKEGIRNILSCTTTLELGIDIGGLNGVLMANVPPNLANYRQRAGRAGRRADGSAVVTTYARSRPFDRAVFNNFDTFLSRQLPIPVVHLDRKHIVERHLRSYLFSTWIKQNQPEKAGAMNAFGKMGQFLGIKTPPKWESKEAKPEWAPEWNKDRAKEFADYLEACKSSWPPMKDKCLQVVKETALEADISKDSGWDTFIENTKTKFEEALDEWWKEIEPFVESWKEINESDSVTRSVAWAIHFQVDARCEITVIDWLASKKFLPRFGFPINLLKLLVLKSGNQNSINKGIDDKFKLERQSVLALREYVPESEIIVSGKILTSRGINRHWTGQDINRAIGLQRYACECAEGHVTLKTDPEEPCGVKDCQGGINRFEKLFFPKQGFLTAAWDPPKNGRIEETVGKVNVTNSDFLDKGDDLTRKNFGGIPGLEARYKPESTLLVRNAGKKGFGFAVCTKCGFSMSESKRGSSGKKNLSKPFQDHASLYSNNPHSKCWKNAESPVIRNMVLAAEESTEMVVFKYSQPLEPEKRHSLSAALALGGACLLQVDSRQLGVIADNKWEFIVYDATPGGSGHCLELFKRDAEWIEAAKEILHGLNGRGHDIRCERACIECILSFENQYVDPRLDRKAALRLLE